MSGVTEQATRVARRLVRRPGGTVGLGVLATTIVLFGSSFPLGSLTQVAGAATPSVPYTDPTAAGYIGLCDQHGQQVYSGNIDTIPFAWRAVSSTAAPSSVSGSGKTATLYAFQPIEGVEAAYWSGEQLTGSTVYSNAASPTVVATARDLSLSNFLNVYHPMWDGFIELRIYLDAPNQEPYVASYPALNLYINGDTWQAVGGGSVNCNASQAISDETLLGVAGTGSTTTSTSAPSTSTSTTSPARGGTSTGSKAGSGSDSAGGGQEADASADVPAQGSPSAPLLVGVVVAVVAAASVAAFVIRRRRRNLP